MRKFNIYFYYKKLRYLIKKDDLNKFELYIFKKFINFLKLIVIEK